jgi:hypothetical protein
MMTLFAMNAAAPFSASFLLPIFTKPFARPLPAARRERHPEAEETATGNAAGARPFFRGRIRPAVAAERPEEEKRQGTLLQDEGKKVPRAVFLN